MGNRIQQRLVSSFTPQETSDDTLKGVVICEVGEAKGHGFYLGEKFLDQVVLIGNRKQIKVRVDHPEQGQSGKVLSIIGQAFNFRRDGDKVRADVKLFDVPAKNIILQLAKQASNLFGMSLDFIGKTGKKMKNGLEEVFCKDVDAVDFVESPAATNALFSEKVDSQNEDESDDSSGEEKPKSNFMNFDKETLSALGLEEGADEKSIKAAILEACSSKKMDEPKEEDKKDAKKDDDKDGEKKEEMAEGDESKKDDKKEEVKAEYSKKAASIQLDEKQISEIVAEQVAKQFTALLAKTGHKPKVSASEETQNSKQDESNSFGFNEEEIKFAKKEGIELKAWRETLNKASAKSFKLSK